MSANFDPADSFEKRGYTLNGFFDATRAGFDALYESGKADGFSPSGAISEASKERVDKVFAVLQEQYGNIDLKGLGSVAIISALGLFQQLQTVLAGFESFSNAKPEDFEQAREAILKERVAKYGTNEYGKYSG